MSVDIKKYVAGAEQEVVDLYHKVAAYSKEELAKLESFVKDHLAQFKKEDASTRPDGE